MRSQAIAIFLTVVISLIGVSYYQVGEGITSDGKALGEAASRSQIAALIPAFLSEFKIINEQFDAVAPRVLGQPADFTDAVSNRFEMVARLQLVNGNWAIQQRAFHEKTRVKAWADNYTQIALKGLKPRDIPMGGTALTALLDPQRRPFFLWIMRDERDQWASVITKTDVFQGIIDRQRGQNVAIFLVNKTGQALGHTTADYVGTILKDDPVVADILRANKAQGIGTFRTNSGVDVQGLYEQVPGSNTYVVLSRPLTALNDRVGSLRLQILLMGGGLMLVGLAVMMLTLKNATTARPGGPPNLGIAASAGATPPATAAAPIAPAGASMAADLAREKMKAYTTSASALAREMHGPLTRILSQAQILKAKSVNLEEVTRIEELARDGRNVVLKLLSFAGEEDFKAEPTSINEVLNRTLGVFENRFQMKGIKLDKSLKRMPEVTAHPLALMKVLEALFNNSIEAMERMPKKELKLSLEAEGNFVVMKIQDSGEGITGDKAGQVFDPFFTTKNPSQHSGLGLSTAYGLVREFGGDLQFTSVPGQGAQVVLRFPVGANLGLGEKDASAAMPPVSASPGVLPNLDELPPAKPLPARPGPNIQPLRSVPMPTGPTGSTPAPGMPVAQRPPAQAPLPPRIVIEPPASLGLRPLNHEKPAPIPVTPGVPLGDGISLEVTGQLKVEKTNTSVIQDRAIEETISLIDQVENGPLIPVAGQPGAPPPAASGGALPPTGHPEATAFGKIDKPNFGPKKPAPKVGSASVSIRKPGERK